MNILYIQILYSTVLCNWVYDVSMLPIYNACYLIGYLYLVRGFNSSLFLVLFYYWNTYWIGFGFCIPHDTGVIVYYYENNGINYYYLVS